jgi:hypothetical protein
MPCVFDEMWPEFLNINVDKLWLQRVKMSSNSIKYVAWATVNLI